ncbi:MAG TPA: hypothetical protein VFN53_12915 [Acidobacteriaceae bacterium]|nr:hypothetical protein [Acidobacteriaceae bacterium]
MRSVRKSKPLSSVGGPRRPLKAGEVDVTASAVVAAVQAYSKINAAGQWIDRTEQVSLNDLFDRMSTAELEEYAQSGRVPNWFEAVTVGATEGDSPE